MRYTIRHFDLPLLTFEANMDSADTDLHIIKVYEENRSFLPLNLTVSEDGVERWLRHRAIPKNRAYVDALLSKVGLSLNRPLGIIAANKALSLNDCFWVDAEGSGDTFKKVNLYDNRFSQVRMAHRPTGWRTVFVSPTLPTLPTLLMLPGVIVVVALPARVRANPASGTRPSSAGSSWSHTCTSNARTMRSPLCRFSCSPPRR